MLPALLLSLFTRSAFATDWHEPDDTLADAQRAAPVYHVVGQPPMHMTSLIAEAGGEDWIHFYADCCNTIGAQVAWIGPGRALRVELYDAAGNLITPNTPGVHIHRQAGRVRVTVDAVGGDWFLRVLNPTGTPLTYQARLLAPVYVY